MSTEKSPNEDSDSSCFSFPSLLLLVSSPASPSLMTLDSNSRGSSSASLSNLRILLSRFFFAPERKRKDKDKGHDAWLERVKHFNWGSCSSCHIKGLFCYKQFYQNFKKLKQGIVPSNSMNPPSIQIPTLKNQLCQFLQCRSQPRIKEEGCSGWVDSQSESFITASRKERSFFLLNSDCFHLVGNSSHIVKRANPTKAGSRWPFHSLSQPQHES